MDFLADEVVAEIRPFSRRDQTDKGKDREDRKDDLPDPFPALHDHHSAELFRHNGTPISFYRSGGKSSTLFTP